MDEDELIPDYSGPKPEEPARPNIIFAAIAIGIALVFVGWALIEHFYPGGM